MNERKSKLPVLWVLIVITAVLIFILETFLPSGQGGSLLFNLTFWIALVEGSIAVVAASEISNGKWLKPFKRELLSVYPLLPVFAVLFIIFIPRVEYFPWSHEEGIWLNKNLFILRSILFPLVAFVSARKFAIESLKESPKQTFYGVIYILVFVTSQTSVAFDWIMSLEYPWFSTLFGGLLFIEAFYMGLGLGGALIFIYHKYYKEAYPDTFEKSRMDVATLLFAFATFWGAQFYTQYLVIWYGNIPEEVSMIAYRVASSPLREFSYLMVVFLFVIPFLTFLSKKLKANYTVFLLISLVVWTGVSIHRLVFIAPRLSTSPLLLIVEFILIGVLFIYVVKYREELIPHAA